MQREMFVTADNVANDLGVSTGFAYKLIKRMNEELKAQGYITIAGRISRKYYEERLYGFNETKEA